jgi:ubiquinone/menaquinone biosynthesis C-methylase UbiE
MRKGIALLAGAGAAGAAGALWWRRHPSACPYSQRIVVQLPHPGVTRRRLVETLAPRSGERILEVGPGTGYYTLDVAAAVAPARLALLDVQREMLDHVARRAADRGIDNLEAVEGDALALPWPDDEFDAAYLVTVLGEIPDQDAALRELARVLRPGGRLVVGEIAFDPHMVTASALERRGSAAGLRFERRAGTPLAYCGLLVKPGA